MKTLNVYEIGVDNPPKDGQEVIWLKENGEIKYVTAEIVWDDGDGGTLCYDGESYYEGFALKIIFDGWDVQNGDKWISEDDYWEVVCK